MDLLVLSAVRTIVPYLATCAIVGVALGLGYFVLHDMEPTDAAAPPTLGSVLPTLAVLSVVAAYTEIVTMRVIGLYYRHFSHRFLWSAG